MILYYSSTGNSKHIADRLGNFLNSKPVDMCSIKEKTINVAHEDLYIVTFNCFWGLSEKVKSFIEQTEFKNIKNLIFILTCGGILGGADRQVEEICAEKSLPKPTIYELRMVTNYSILHGIPNIDAQKRKLKKADIGLEKIMQGKKKAYHSPFIMKLLQPYIHRSYKAYQSTKPFYVLDSCISCSQCEKNCPASAIKMVNGKPQWIKPQCDNCLKCLHLCPKEAINYGKTTVKRLRYFYKNPKNAME